MNNYTVTNFHSDENIADIDINFKYQTDVNNDEQNISLYKIISENTARVIEYGQINELVQDLNMDPVNKMKDGTLQSIFSRLYTENPVIFTNIIDFMNKYISVIIASLVNDSINNIDTFKLNSQTTYQSPLFTGDEKEIFESECIENTELNDKNNVDDIEYNIDKRILEIAKENEEIRNVIDEFKKKVKYEHDHPTEDTKGTYLKLVIETTENNGNVIMEKRYNVDKDTPYSIYNISNKVIQLSNEYPEVLKYINAYKKKAMLEFIHPSDETINTHLELVAEVEQDNTINIIEKRVDDSDLMNNSINKTVVCSISEFKNNDETTEELLNEEIDSKQIIDEMIDKKYHNPEMNKSVTYKKNRKRKPTMKKVGNNES